MKLSELRRMRNELNTRYFGGILKEIPIRITRAKSYYGDFVYRPAAVNGNCSLRVSGPLHASMEEVRETLLHELIHQFLFETTGRAGEDHGPEFVREAFRVKLDLQKDYL